MLVSMATPACAAAASGHSCISLCVSVEDREILAYSSLRCNLEAASVSDLQFVEKSRLRMSECVRFVKHLGQGANVAEPFKDEPEEEGDVAPSVHWATATPNGSISAGSRMSSVDAS